MNVQTYNDIYDSAKALMIANQTKITDFNQGSIISTIFETFARLLENGYIDVRNGYSQNLKSIAYSIFGFQKKEGQKAVANVIFSRGVTQNTQTVIPVDTRISNGSLIFITTATGTIEANQLKSNSIPVIAENIGLEYNVSANTLTTIETVLPTDVVSVTNPLKASGGIDNETELEMLSRFKTFINGLQGTSKYGFKSSILALPGVRSISIDEHYPPENHIYNATVYIDDGTGGLSTELKEQIESIINGDDTSINPGKRASGVNIRVLAATPVTINVEVTCKIYRTEHAQAELEITDAIQQEINSLSINENFVLTSLILKLRQISYVKDVVITTPSGNVDIDINQIARFGTATINLVDM